MRRDLRRAMIEIVVPRGMRYDGVTAYERMVDEDPLDADLLLEAWRYAALEGYGDRFEAYYRDVQQQASRDYRWTRLLATLAEFRGDLDDQLAWLEALLRLEPHRVDVHDELVQLYLRVDRFDEALEHLDRIRFLTGNEVDYHLRAADIAFLRGQAREGERHLLQVRDLVPESADTLSDVVRRLGDHGSHEAAIRLARTFLTDTAAPLGEQVAETRRQREVMFRALVDATLRSGDPRAARDAWWEGYRSQHLVDGDRFAVIYGAPGMVPDLRRDLERHQEELIVDGALRRAVENHLRAAHLVREQAAVATLVLDAELLDRARTIAATYGSAGGDRDRRLDPSIRRRFAALAGSDHRGVYRKVAWRPAGTPSGSLSADHARAVELLLRWERERVAAGTGGEGSVGADGLPSTHPDVEEYARRYDRGHRELARFYAQRHLYLDAAAELRQIELLFGPLYRDVYAEQLDLLSAQIDAGVDAAAARRERRRILALALDAAVAEMERRPPSRGTPAQGGEDLASSALVRYLTHAAAAGDDKAFGEAHERLLGLTGVAGPYPDGTVADEEREWIERVLCTVNAAAEGGSTRLALDAHRRGVATLPDDVSLQRELLEMLARRGDRAQVMAEVERGIEATGRLWIHRWAVEYLAGPADDPDAALALCERALESFGSDLDLRLAHVELLVRTGDQRRAAEEIAFLVGNQTVGGFLQGQQIVAAAAFAAPPDQERTALGNHAIHALTATERERLFQLWAAATGDARVLTYTVERHPRDAGAYEAMARAALDGGHHELALESLRKVRVLMPEDPARTWGLEGEAHWEAGHRDQALQVWRRLAREPYPEAVQQAFDLMWARGLHDQAVDLAASEVVRRQGFDRGGGGQGPSIVGHAVERIDETREYDLLGHLYRGVAPAVTSPRLVAAYAAHLERVHRPDAAQAFLDDVVAGLPEVARLSVLYSIASQAHAAERFEREREALDAIIDARPEDISWRVLRVRALAMAGDPAAIDAAADTLSANRTSTGLRYPDAARQVLQLLARGEVAVDGAAADRLRAVLADERYGEYRDLLVAPVAELELAAGRPGAAVEVLRGALDEHPESRQVWLAALDLLEERGAADEACVLRGQQAAHLLTYLPADAEAMLIEARAAVCDGRPDDGVRRAAEAQRANPGLVNPVLDRARFLLEIGRAAEALEVAEELAGELGSTHAVAAEVELLAADAALAAGDGAGAARRFVDRYAIALDDLLAEDDRAALAAWAVDARHPERAPALAGALEDLGARRDGDARPYRLAATLYRAAGRPAAAEPALRRVLERQPADPSTVVQLADILLDPARSTGGAVEEASLLVEDLFHLDPGRCDAGRLRFRVAAAAGDPDAWEQARQVASMSCAGVPDLVAAEELLREERRYLDAVEALRRLEQIDAGHRTRYRQLMEEAIAAHERAAREEVPR